MKKIITLILSLVMICSIGLFSTSCGDKKTIVVGYTLYEPMNYQDEQGNLVGFDTELAKKTFGDLGYNVTFTLIDWNNKYLELSGGTIDCIWNGFTANSTDKIDGVDVPRAALVDFTYMYMLNAQCIIRKNSSAELTSVAEFNGKSVAFEIGSAGDSFVGELTGVSKVGRTSQMDAVLEVLSGTADYAVVDILLAQSLAGKGNFTNIVINQGIEMETEYYAVGFKKGSDLTAKVNAKFTEYASNGYLMQLAEKYGLSTKVITDFTSQAV